MAEAFAETEMLDIERTIESESLAVRPREILSFGDRRIAVAIMLFLVS